jgi:hypothetical protein
MITTTGGGGGGGGGAAGALSGNKHHRALARIGTTRVALDTAPSGGDSWRCVAGGCTSAESSLPISLKPPGFNL